MNSKVRPSLEEVYSLLQEKNALVVHFSGAPKGSGVNRLDHLFPNDLLHATNLKASGGLSCSVVMPDDIFSGTNERNAIGCVGVVLGLQNPESLVGAASTDCGSYEDEHGQRKCPQQDHITIQNLRETIENRVSYNEWIIRDYGVLGIFAIDPLDIGVLGHPNYPDDMPDYLKSGEKIPLVEQTTFQMIKSSFPKYPIYTFNNSRLCELKDADFIEVKHTDIYQI